MTPGDSPAVVRRNSVNPESMYSKEGPVRVDRFMPTRTDMILSTRISATQICQLAFIANPGVKWGEEFEFSSTVRVYHNADIAHLA